MLIILVHSFNHTNILISAVYNWKGDVRSGLPLEIGETVQILEENGGKSMNTYYINTLLT